MDAVLLKKFFSSVDVSYLAGPILDKELRVLSRRKRYYVLRFVYLAVLTVFTAVVFNTVTSSYSAIYTSSRTSEAGLAITMFMISFQFFFVTGAFGGFFKHRHQRGNKQKDPWHPDDHAD